jgi:ribosomal protein L11 methyltransferase
LNYLAINVQVSAEYNDILIAELSQIGFDTFQDTDHGFEGFTEEENMDRSAIIDIITRYSQFTSINYTFRTIEKKNWNEEWEKSFSPVIIKDKCIVRATFHTTHQKYPYEIVINPKMSFGTGHHATTALMLEKQLGIDHTNKKVMDIGSGTGILAIMAEKLGASKVFAFDIEDWAVENAIENSKLNNCSRIAVVQGDIKDVVEPGELYDIVLANINRNVLLQQIQAYSSHLAPNGVLLLSGFYDTDTEEIRLCGKDAGLIFRKMDLKDQWACILMQKLQ